MLLVVAFRGLGDPRTPEPMIPMSFFRSRAFSAGNLRAIFCVFASLFAEVYFFSQFLQNGDGL